MMDHITAAAFAVAKSTTFVVLLIAQTVASVAGTVTLFAAEVNDGVLAGMALFVGGIFVSIIGWSLVLLVRLSGVVTRLESENGDHNRRLESLETFATQALSAEAARGYKRPDG